MTSETYVHVRDEPRHRLRFENDYARIYDVLIPPNDTTLFHEHTEDTLYISIGQAVVEDKTFEQETRPTITVPPSIAMCRHHRVEPLIHRVSNVGQENMRMIGIEVKASPDKVTQTAIDVPFHTFAWDEPRLRAYRLHLKPGEANPNLEYPFSGAVVFLSSCVLTRQNQTGAGVTTTNESGTVIWMDSPDVYSIENVGTTDCDACVVE